MKYRHLKQHDFEADRIQTTHYLNDGKVHWLANHHQKIAIINWNGHLKQLQQFFGTISLLHSQMLLIDDHGDSHVISNISTPIDQDDHQYQSFSLPEHFHMLQKHTLLIRKLKLTKHASRYYSYQYGDVEIIPVNANMIHNHFPIVIH